jgi:ribonuclease HII
MTTAFEQRFWTKYRWVCGVDEVGRGPLAGPVVAAAVMFEKGFTPDEKLQRVADSKKLSPQARTELAQLIHHTAVAVGIGEVDAATIDRLNILNATFLAMTKAIEQLRPQPEFLLIDGNRYRTMQRIAFETVVKGDSKVFSIAAASIVAKVYRDKLMSELDTKFPQYGFARHFGYPTPEHIEAIRKYGRCEIHRNAFKLSALGEKT